jgi:phosphatidylserine/phosphatidylglycerophosphate/cardiolipin synthase-like enzyme
MPDAVDCGTFPIVNRWRRVKRRITPVASPQNFLPRWRGRAASGCDDRQREDVGRGATTDVQTSVGREYYDVDGAFRRAAARGVKVRLLCADWCKRASTIPYLKSLTVVPNIEVKLITIPESSKGFIPFARVIHSKYMVVDGHASWIGTSNWERDYFHQSRNVGITVESEKIAAILTRYFASGWESAYAYRVDPAADYTPPRISE